MNIRGQSMIGMLMGMAISVGVVLMALTAVKTSTKSVKKHTNDYSVMRDNIQVFLDLERTLTYAVEVGEVEVVPVAPRLSDGPQIVENKALRAVIRGRGRGGDIDKLKDYTIKYSHELDYSHPTKIVPCLKIIKTDNGSETIKLIKNIKKFKWCLPGVELEDCGMDIIEMPVSGGFSSMNRLILMIEYMKNKGTDKGTFVYSVIHLENILAEESYSTKNLKSVRH